MSLDISRTETFLPVFWVITKYVYTYFVASVLLDLDKSLLQINTNTYTYTQRATLMLVTYSVLTETKYDNIVLQQSNIMEKLCYDGKRVSYVNLLKDATCISIFVLLHCIGHGDMHEATVFQNISTNSERLHRANDRPTAGVTPLVWCFVGTAHMLFNIILNHSALKQMAAQINLTTRVSLVFLFAITITSDSLSVLFTSMTVHELLYRLGYYVFFVLIRCYTEGLAFEDVKSINNLCLISWVVIIPQLMLHVLFLGFVITYVLFYLLSLQKNSAAPIQTPQVQAERPVRVPELLIDENLLQKLNERAPNSRRITTRTLF